MIELRRGTTYRFLINGGNTNTVAMEKRRKHRKREDDPDCCDRDDPDCCDSDDPDDDSYPNHYQEYHPFYLTSSIAGGYAQLAPSERIKQRILAGIRLVVEQPTPNSPYVVGFEPTALGPLCLFTETKDSYEAAAGGTCLTEVPR